MKTRISFIQLKERIVEVRLEPTGTIWYSNTRGFYSPIYSEEPIRSLKKAKLIVQERVKM